MAHLEVMFMCWRRAAVSLIFMLALVAAAAKADEPPIGGSSQAVEAPAARLIGLDGSKSGAGDPIEARSSKAAYATDTPAVRFAMCGVEADAGNTGLDAGLIDFNVPDPARAAGRVSDDQQGAGRNVPDYHASVFLGVTLGYHF